MGLHLWTGENPDVVSKLVATTSLLLLGSDGKSAIAGHADFLAVLYRYKTAGGAALTAKPWSWADVLWLQRKCGLYLPVEVQLFVLLVGWTRPFLPMYDPVATYWCSMGMWACKDSETMRGVTVAQADSPGTAMAKLPGPPCRRLRDGGYLTLGYEFVVASELDSDAKSPADGIKVFVVDVKDGTRGTVYWMVAQESASSSSDNSSCGSESDADSDDGLDATLKAMEAPLTLAGVTFQELMLQSPWLAPFTTGAIAEEADSDVAHLEEK